MRMIENHRKNTLLDFEEGAIHAPRIINSTWNRSCLNKRGLKS